MPEFRTLELARPRIDVLLTEARPPLEKEISRAKGDAALRGMASSSPIVLQVAELCAADLRRRADGIWGTLKEVATQLGEERAPEFKNAVAGEIESQVRRQTKLLAGLVEQECERALGTRGQLAEQVRTVIAETGELALKRIRSELDLFVESPRESDGRGSTARDARNVFLSHAASDREIAIVLKSELERRLPGIGVFCSSDPTDLPPGSNWPSEIHTALSAAATLLVLASTRGLSRPWVWFEIGTFWFSEGPVIPLCIGEARKNNLPSPLRERQGLNVDEPVDLQALLEAVASAAGVSADSSALADLAERLKSLDTIATGGGHLWRGVEWNDRFLAYEGPIEGLRLIEDEPFQQAIAEALESGGYRPFLAAADGLSEKLDKGYRVVQLTDRQSWRRRISLRETVLVARPKGTE